MAYTPDPTDVSQPVESVFAKTAAAEFRALKVYLAAIVAGGGPGAQTPGMIADFPYAAAPAGWLAADGSIQLRSSFPTLWAFVVATGSTVSEVDWNAGRQGMFSVGDGVTTFRLPDFRGTQRRGLDGGRGLDAGRVLGAFQDSRTGNHNHRLPIGWDTGTVYMWNDGAGNPIMGSEVVGGATHYTAAKGGPFSGSIRVGYTDAARAQSDETRVMNYSVLTCIKT